VRPLDLRDDFRRLAVARSLATGICRTCVSATVSTPKGAVRYVGGLDPDLAQGCGVEDTHLDAKSVAAGLKIGPIREVVGFHVNPADADLQWRSEMALWPRNTAPLL
jgi:hypothetical protein